MPVRAVPLFVLSLLPSSVGALVPDDPRYPDQWALPMIHAPAAWARTTGSSDVVVAVLDTGITAHPDLANRLVPGYDFVSDARSAGDGDGRDPDPTDTGPWKHGTHVAGIIGAGTNDGVGVAGLDWACRIQAVRVIGADRVGKAEDVADAIRWAAGLHVDGVPDNATPADVINLSVTTPGHSDAEQAAIHDALARGVIVVAAAGNEGIDASDGSPGGLDGVITIGAVDDQGRTAAYSNGGSRVSLLAPGGSLASGVLSTIQLPNGAFDYGRITGTSQAAPFVSGTIALMKSLDPALSSAEARALLELSAGARLLDVDAALAATEAFDTGALHLDLPPSTAGCALAGAGSASPGAIFLALGAVVLARIRGRRR